MRTRFTLAVALGALCLLGLTPALVAAAGPTTERWTVQDTFDDDFIFDLCGIDTRTTLTERVTVKSWPDGRVTLHVVRTYVSDHEGVPLERGAATRFISADGLEVVVGMPTQLHAPGGGVTLIDAGRTIFGDPIIVHGKAPSLEVDLAEYYCPAH